MNPNRQILLLLSLVACAWSTVDAREKKRAGTPSSTPDRTVATPLRKSTDTSTTDAIADPNGFFAWVDPARCDQDGNLFFLIVPPAAPGPLRPRSPREIVGVSADGKSANHLDPGSLPVFRGAGELHTITTALDSQGFLFALVWVPHARADGRQFIVTFDKAGRYASRLEVDPDEIYVEQFEVFGTGDFLLRGVRCDASNVEVPSGGRCVRRMAVMSSGGSSYRDVFIRDHDGLGSSKETGPATPPRIDHMVRGGDGRIYVARTGTSSIYAIEASGQGQAAFPLARTSPDLRLAGLRASGGRLVATYNDGRPRQLRWWLAVYDVALGQRMGLFGPVDGYPLCYQYTHSEDRFRVLRDGNRLVTLSP